MGPLGSEDFGAVEAQILAAWTWSWVRGAKSESGLCGYDKM